MDTDSARDVQVKVDSKNEQKPDVKPHSKQHEIQQTTKAEHQGSTYLASSVTESQEDSKYKVVTGLVKDQPFAVINQHGDLKTFKEQCAELSDPKSMTSENREYTEHDHPTDTSDLVMDGQLKAEYNSQKPGMHDCCLHRENKRSESCKLSLEKFRSQHIYKNGSVSLCNLSAIVSGIEGCEKSFQLKKFMDKVIKLKDDTQEQSSFEEKESKCLSCNKLIILGEQPCETLSWMHAGTETENAIICLLSYFANYCKKQYDCNEYDYYKILEFVPTPATSETIEKEIPERIKFLYTELIEHWKKLGSDKNLSALALSSAVCLVNVFNVGYCNATQDIFPFIRKYCKHAVHVVGYDQIKHGAILSSEGEPATCPPCMPKLLQQFCGVHKGNPVFLIAICNGEKRDSNQEAEIEKAVKQKAGNEFHSLCIHHETFDDVKAQIEERVRSSDFFDSTPIKYPLFLEYIVKASKTFWMQRCEIESLAPQYGLKTDEIENFLQYCTSYGSMFYTHDVPALKDYVIVDIVKFVQQIHKLYNSENPTTKYGIFEERAEADWKVIFEFLTTFGIAIEVKSSQIAKIDSLRLKTATTYYYIPTTRDIPKLPPNLQRSTSWSTCDIFSLKINPTIPDQCTEVHLCKHLFINVNCSLIPTDSLNSTSIRYFDEHQKTYDIKFVRHDSQLLMKLVNKQEHADGVEIRGAFSQMLSSICPFLRSKKGSMSMGELSSMLVAGAQQKKKGKLARRLPTKKLIKIAKELSKQAQTKKEEISIKLGLETDWTILPKDEDESESDVIQCIFDDFLQSKTEDDLIAILKDFIDDI